jgi:ATP-binding cassette subfamily C protein
LAVGLVIIAGGTYAISGTEAAVAAVTVFAAAGFRLLPIVNRIQGLILQLFSTFPAAQLALLEQTPTTTSAERKDPAHILQALVLENVSFKYPSSTTKVLAEINLSLQTGLQYAIVGPSGAGKTTLVDICLGLLQPQEGAVHVSSAAIAYVPQDTHIARLSLQQNIALEWNLESINEPSMNAAIDKAQLTHVLDGRQQMNSLSKGFRVGKSNALGLPAQCTATHHCSFSMR